MDVIYNLIQITLGSMTILLVVALGGLLSERSGVTNIALEGIMIFGAFLGIWAIQGFEVYPYSPMTKFAILIVTFSIGLIVGYFILQLIRKFLLKKEEPMKIKDLFIKESPKFNLLFILGVALIIGLILFFILNANPMSVSLVLLMGLAVAGVMGGLYAMVHGYAAIHLKSNQIISATALNLFAPALAIFTRRVITQGGQQIKFNSNFIIQKVPLLGDIPVLGDLFFKRVYLSFYVGLVILIIVAFVVNKTKFGLRLRACGENPHAADSLGINIYKLRFKAVALSGVLAGMGGVMFVTTFSNEFNVTVAGFGFLAIAVLIFGNWRPSRILLAALFFGFMRTIASSYSSIGFLRDLALPGQIYDMIPYVATLVVLMFASKNSRAPKALGQVYDQGKR